MLPEQQHREPTINDRVDVNGFRGTVKYIGQVKDTPGTWLGIEWDDPSRGKHNGTHSGISYFSTKYPTSGSLLRPHKVNLGVSIVDAIVSRYGLVKDEHAGIDVDTIALVQREIKASVFEFVGAEKINKKQSQYEKLQIVSLREQPINGAGPPKALSNLCPNIRELDLSKTLLNSWRSVAEIAQQLDRLEVLDLSENFIEIEGELKYAFGNLKHLIFGRADLSWRNVVTCCKSLMNLKILQVPFNNIDEIISADDTFEKLTELDLEGNPIESWAHVNKLGTLKNLTTLNLNDCRISEINFEDKETTTTATTRLFPALQHLILNENLINNWTSISELDKLQNLRDLKCLKNPFLEGETMETNHQFFIARIKNLEILNGSIILPDERKGAEIDFLKRHGREFLQIDDEIKKTNFQLLYPCYQRLVKKHGAPEESELNKNQSNRITSNLIQVILLAESDSKKSFVKKLPGNMSVQKLGGLVQRLFGLGSVKPKLSSVPVHLEQSFEVPMDNEMKDLNFYSIQNGDQILVRW